MDTWGLDTWVGNVIILRKRGGKGEGTKKVKRKRIKEFTWAIILWECALRVHTSLCSFLIYKINEFLYCNWIKRNAWYKRYYLFFLAIGTNVICNLQIMTLWWNALQIDRPTLLVHCIVQSTFRPAPNTSCLGLISKRQGSMLGFKGFKNCTVLWNETFLLTMNSNFSHV